MMSNISTVKTDISKLGQGVTQSLKNKVVLGLFEDHPDRDVLMQSLDIDISDLWEQSEIFPK